MSTPLRERPDAPLGTLIFRAGLLPAETIESALEEGVKTGKRLGEILTERGLLKEADLARLLAGQRGLEFVTLREQIVDQAAAGLFSEDQARLFRALPYAFEDGVPLVAIADPTDDVLTRNIREALGRDDAKFVVSVRSELGEIIEQVYANAVAPAPAYEPAPEPHAHPEPEFVQHYPPDPEPAYAPDPEPAPEPAPEPVAAEPAPEPVAEAPAAPDMTGSDPRHVPYEHVLSDAAHSQNGSGSPEHAGLNGAATPAAEPVPAPVPEPVAAAEPVPAPAPVPEPVAAAEPVTVPEPAPAPASVSEPVVAPEPVAVSEPVPPAADPEPHVFQVPAPEPASVFVQEPAPVPEPLSAKTAEAPQPVLETPAHPPAPAAPESETYRLSVRLTNGERVEAGAYTDLEAAKQQAKTLMAQVAAADGGNWPFVKGRFLKPDTIVSVDIL